MNAKMKTLTVGEDELSIADILSVARGEARVQLAQTDAYRGRVEASEAVLHSALAQGQPIYGVTRGFGSSCNEHVSPELLDAVPHNLVRFHGCGTGPILDEVQAAAVVAVRLAGLARGYSGVRMKLLEGLCALLNARVIPRIPAQGSVGASGDLTPLSYVAAVLIGERDVFADGDVMPAAAALAKHGIEPLQLAPKESLALMNGTSVMTALGCLALEQAEQLARLATALTAMMCDVTRGNAAHFDERIFDLKPHPGQQRCAAWLRHDLEYQRGNAQNGERLQDRYSLRCAPHVIGVLLDTVEFARGVLTIELNSVNDNPLLDPETGMVFAGGNFYGGHVCQAMDALKTAVASVADLLDRQFALLAEPSTSGGLPADLVGARGAAASANFGFKAMQIAASALTAESLKLTIPASAFSRSTERHNQDKVSMGTIASRDCLQILGWTQTVATIHLLALCQATDLRDRQGCHRRTLALHAHVRETIPMVEQDRAMDADIAALQGALQGGGVPIGDLGTVQGTNE